MAGNLLQGYASGSYTFTAANSLAGSASFVAGAMSLAVNNTATLYEDFLVSGLITWSTTAPASGAATYLLEVRAYGSVNNTPTYPKDGSGNNLGTDAALTFATADDKNNATSLGGAVTLAATASKVYSFKPFSVRQLFGNMPGYHGLFVTHGVTTASSTINASGNTWSWTGCYGTYT
jgi:hypothetical protein